MSRTISVALAVAACGASPAFAQDDATNVNPARVVEDGGEVLIATVPLPGNGAAGLLRVRGTSLELEVLRPHSATPTSSQLPWVWCRVAGDGALVGSDGGRLWRLDATGPERRIVLPEGVDLPGTSFLGQARGVVYFAPHSTTRGAELWRTDGTEAGTRLVRDIEPGRASSWPGAGAPVGSVLFFTARTEAHGRQVWRTDGTAEGTLRVTALPTIPGSAGPVVIGRLGGELAFATDDDEGRSELWLTDGSRQGTRVIATIDDRVDGYGPVLRLGDVLVFGTRGASGYPGPLWRTDGSAVGTFSLLPGSESHSAVVSGGRLWFAAEGSAATRGLWSSDGTRGGTRRVWAQPEAPEWATIIDVVALRGGVAFRGRSASWQGSLWFHDGTTDETTRLADAEIGSPIPNTYYFGMLATTGDVAWFASRGATGADLWTTDGTASGTYPASVAGITDEPEYPAPSPLEPFADGGPVGPEPAPPSDDPDPEPEPPEPIDVRKLRIDLRPVLEVELRLRCRVPLAGAREIEGESLTLDVGGIVTEVVLDARGRARTADGRRLKSRVVRGRGGASDTLRLDLRIRRAPVGVHLLDERLSVPEGASHVDRPIAVEILWRDAVHAAEPSVRYRQRAKRGIAKLLD